MPMKHPGTNIDVPAPRDSTARAGFTGYNSLDLQQIYVAARYPVMYRSQIARAHGKPIVVRLPDGSLLASQYKSLRVQRNPRYPDALVEAALCRSDDEGRTWSEPRYLGLPGRPTIFTALRDGTLILGTETLGFDEFARVRLSRSTDGGETWVDCQVEWESLADAAPGWQRGFGETNGVLELPDGTLLLPCFLRKTDWEHYDDFKGFILRSYDAGRTWSDATFSLYTYEISLLRLPNGRILTFPRLTTPYVSEVWQTPGGFYEGGDTVALMESSDEGRTWSEPRRIGLGMAQVPAFPYLLDDGRLILIYGNRQFPFGCAAIASCDQGQTWDTDHFIMLAWFSWDNFCGHPRSELLPDGSVLTGYYLRPFKESDDADEDVASHVVRWRVPEDWPPH